MFGAESRRKGTIFDCPVCLHPFQHASEGQVVQCVPVQCAICERIACWNCLWMRVTHRKPCPFCQVGMVDKRSILVVSNIQELYVRYGRLNLIEAKDVHVEPLPFAMGRTAVFYRGRFRGSRVALKVFVGLHQMSAAMEAYMQLLQRIRHPSVATFYGVVALPAGIALVLEYVKGGDLTQWMSRFGSKCDPLAISLNLARALQYVHSLGMIHGGLKPQNVFVSDGERGEVKLADFTVERGWLDDNSDFSSQSLMSPVWLAPEVLRGLVADRSSDIYSLGILIYSIFSGQAQPYLKKDSSALQIVVANRLIARIVSGYRPDSSGMPERIQMLLRATWMDAPSARISLSGLMQGLEALLRSRDSGVSGVGVGEGMVHMISHTPRPFSENGWGGLPVWSTSPSDESSAGSLSSGAVSRSSSREGVAALVAVPPVEDGKLILQPRGDTMAPADLIEILKKQVCPLLADFLRKIAAYFKKDVQEFVVRPGQSGTFDWADERELVNTIRCRENWDKYFSKIFRVSHGIHPMLLRVKTFLNLMYHVPGSPSDEPLTTEVARKRVGDIHRFLEILGKLPQYLRVDSGAACESLLECAKLLVVPSGFDDEVVPPSTPPAVMAQSTMRTSARVQSNRELHLKGQCKPCRFFFLSPDLKCPYGEACMHCHFADPVTGGHEETGNASGPGWHP